MTQLYIIPEYDRFEDSLQLAQQYGLAFEFNDFYMPEVLDDRGRQAEIIAHYRKMHTDFSKDTIHGAFLDVTIHSSDPLIRAVSEQRVRQSMDIAVQMGVRGVVFHTGRLKEFCVEYYVNQWLEMNEVFFRKLAMEYPGIQIFMENMFDEAPDILAQLARRMRDVSSFSVCFDYAHGAVMNCGQREWMNTLAPYIRHMHINDNDLKNDLHQAVGDGQIDWQEYSSLMREHHIDATTLIEVTGQDKQRRSLEYMLEHHIYPCHKEPSIQ